MASGPAGIALDFANRADNREISPLKLGAEHIPFPCSLRELVMDRYAEPGGGHSGAQTMHRDELIEYLKNVDDFTLAPWNSVVRQTELIGDPAVPSQEQAAILKWLGRAIELWRKQYPLEEPLDAEVRRLIPLAAALAIFDPKFLQPGAHPLHRLFDTIQSRAIGWQSRLDRVGTILLQQVSKTVDQSRLWFEKPSTNLTGICAEFSTAAERDQARAQRMVQRVVETELGKVKTAAAKHEAARMINAGLANYPAPADIGEFVKGPWYSSAQLLLLKFGVDSEQWQKMSATTVALLDSLQSLEEAEESRRQHIFEAVTQLPKEMRRWLLSLHHDTEAVNEAMGRVEFAHLRILRRQSLDLKQIEPIVADDGHTPHGDSQYAALLKDCHEGQWFKVDSNKDGTLRAQLVLKVEHAQQLLFTNMAGIKILQLNFAEFGKLLEQKKATPLHSGSSFSLCLASAVGVESDELLDALVKVLGEADSDVEPGHKVEEKSTPEPESESEPATAADFHSGLEQEQAIELDPGSALDTAETSESESIPEEESELEFAPEISAPPQSTEELPELTEESPGDDDSNLDSFPQEAPQEPKQRGDYLIDQAEDIKARGGFRSELTQTADAEPLLPVQEVLEEEPASESLQPESEIVQQRQINLPMGSWLGFHDGETPLMARLAVHDPQEDYYIFVNRKGVKMRQVSTQELLDLVDTGMVEILETHSNFREEVTQVRKSLDKK